MVSVVSINIIMEGSQMTKEELKKELEEAKKVEEIEWNAYLEHIASTIHCPLCDYLHERHSYCQMPEYNDEPLDWWDEYDPY